METWATDFSSGAGSAADRRSKGTQKGFQKGGNKPKKPRQETNALANLAVAGTELGLHNERLLRQLFGMAVSTLLCPENEGIKKAASVDSVDSDADIARWALIAHFLSKCSQVPQPARRVLEQHVKEHPSAQTLSGKILSCYVAPIFNFKESGLYMVQFSVDSSIQNIANAIISALVTLGGTAQHGPPPRVSSARKAADALKTFRQDFYE
jgi:hypothetical protein